MIQIPIHPLEERAEMGRVIDDGKELVSLLRTINALWTDEHAVTMKLDTGKLLVMQTLADMNGVYIEFTLNEVM